MKGLIRSLLIIVVPFILIACSGSPVPKSQTTGNNNGGGSGSNGSSGPFTIGGSVSGLSGSGLVLQDNLADNLTITASGTFTFHTSIANNGTYSVSILTQPSGPTQTCSVANASGTATANVTNVQVVCTSSTTASIGGQVTGLTASGLVLQDNGGDNLTINKSGSFTFATPVNFGSTYAVTVLTQPTNPSEICTVASGSGTANGNVGNVVVTCSPGTLTLGGSVSGLSGSGLVLQSVAGNVTISANGTFTFPTLVPSGTAYTASVSTQPTAPSQTCTITNASGTATSNVTSIQVTCPAVFFPVGGQVVGLAGTGGGGAVLQNNGGDNLPLTGNGPFTFVTEIASGGQYDVNMFVAPNTQPGIGCVIWGWQGLVTAAVTSVLVDCGHDDWTWMNGANTANAKGSTGATLPLSTSPPTSFLSFNPGGRRYPATWVDSLGNLWLFGGYGWDLSSNNPAQPYILDDMWVYSGAQYYDAGYLNYWAQPKITGNFPSERWGAVTWTDSSGTMWLFGGQDGGLNFLNDLWSFTFNPGTGVGTWTLVSTGTYNFVSNSSPGSYGMLGTASGSNWPGGRWGATGRLDSAGNLWMFGGFGWDAASSSPGLLNDLWERKANGQWVWLNGSKTTNQDGVYGTQGTGASTNVPGGRQASVSWLDPSGNFWMFGGYNLSPLGQPNAFNDLWEFSGGQWTWVSGANVVNQTASFGIIGTPAASNVPGARWASAAWSDPAGRLWLFGGEGFDPAGDGTLGDLWSFDTRLVSGKCTCEWTWQKGPSAVSQIGDYGLTPAPAIYPHVVNFPGTRWGAGYWTVTTGSGTSFWMFGGEGYDSTVSSDGIGLLNDMWRYLPYP